MNIVVVGAGAIGSFFGGMLSKQNNVILLGRTNHIEKINENGLKIHGKTELVRNIKAVDESKKISITPDLLLLTVKAFDTKQALCQVKEIIQNKTIVLSIQNGLNNVNHIKQIVPKEQMIMGITSHGVQFEKAGIIIHKGIGSTVIGELTKQKTKRIQRIASTFQISGISVDISEDIIQDIWKKAIINASINPLTTIFNCRNGYLLDNPLLSRIVEMICEESVLVAQKQGFPLSVKEMIDRTKEVITNTKENRSSMLQSIQQNKKTEICQINGKISEIGKRYECNVPLNLLLTKIIKYL